MPRQDIPFLSAAETARAVRAKQLSPTEVTEAYLERIQHMDPLLHAYITVTPERARVEAREVERRLMAGDTKGHLLGVPVAVKDQIWTRGVRTTCGFSFYKDFIPSEDATLITRLREAGAILLGKLHISLGSLQEDNPPWPECRNPWDSDRYPGGSSTGSGVALATNLCGVSVGEDTGGSGRNPASWCGVTGLRPTYGRVSRHGVMPFCWYMDIAAPMGKTVEDTALVLQAIAGHDPKDPYTTTRPVPAYTAVLGKPIRGLRIGVVQELMTERVDPEVRRLLQDAIEVLRDLGAHIREVSVPIMTLGGAMYTTLAIAQGYTADEEILATRPTLIRKSTRSWIWAKALLPAAAITDALKARALLRQQLLETFRGVDVLLSPTTSTTAVPFEEYSRRGLMNQAAEAKIAEWLNYCGGYAVAALPALSVPCGFTTAEKPLPAGMQLGGPPFGEERLFQVAFAYQQATDWHMRRPPLPSVPPKSQKS